MISPCVRRLRLAAELVLLREAHGYSSARLAAAIGVPRQRISRLENGHVAPDLDEIRKILHLFEIDSVRADQLMTIARDAQERGWWAKYAGEMGPRQAMYADLEAGACEIREYQMVFLPGLLQTRSYTESRVRLDRSSSAKFDLDHALDARAARQRTVERDGGPAYVVVIDELAIRRPAVPSTVLRIQLDHMVQIGHDRPALTIRVLPLAATIRDHTVPRSAFSCYRYRDPADPIVVAVDTVTDDLVLTQPAEVSRYLELYRKLEEAALPAIDSLDFLAAVAEDFRKGIRDA